MNNISQFPTAQKSWFSIKNIADNSADVFIYDVVGDSWTGNDALTVVKDINALDVENINLRINSPGGSVFDGMAIFNALLNHKAKVTTHIDGVAASIASVIALAGDDIVMSENAMFMIHNPWTLTAGSSAELRKEADVLDQVKETILNTYASRTGGERDDLSVAMDEETWYTASEALKAGFITKVDKASKIAACADETTLSALGITKTPSNLLAQSEPDQLPREPRNRDVERRRLALFGKFNNIQ
tara:strand:+ start:663 stop:1397 length:735 start_codon:yes stop_codon:yes gene_type:complete